MTKLDYKNKCTDWRKNYRYIKDGKSHQIFEFTITFSQCTALELPEHLVVIQLLKEFLVVMKPTKNLAA
jgi:hypothetical protein